MGKARDLFKKIRETKGASDANMGTIKDRNGKYITEAKEINKRWKEYTEELYREGLNGPDHPDAIITHLKADILECAVK